MCCGAHHGIALASYLYGYSSIIYRPAPPLSMKSCPHNHCERDSSKMPPLISSFYANRYFSHILK